jgi:EpsI family protein
MVRRAAVVVALLVAARFYSAHAVSAETPVSREPLSALPLAVGEWSGRDAPPLADDVLGQLGVDDYVNREYVNAAGIPVGLYVGYYASQRQGDTIHSPQNCLPGAGWQPVETGVADLRLGERSARVNRFLIQKGLDRQVVLYWYQGRGRVVANEYRNKALLMFDAARLHRTNGGLVRLIAPINTTAGEAQALLSLSAFATALFPHLDKHLP